MDEIFASLSKKRGFVEHAYVFAEKITTTEATMEEDGVIEPGVEWGVPALESPV